MFKVLWHQLWPVLGWDSLVACYPLLISRGTKLFLFPFSAKEPKNPKMHSVHDYLLLILPAVVLFSDSVMHVFP